MQIVRDIGVKVKRFVLNGYFDWLYGTKGPANGVSKSLDFKVLGRQSCDKCQKRRHFAFHLIPHGSVRNSTRGAGCGSKPRTSKSDPLRLLPCGGAHGGCSEGRQSHTLGEVLESRIGTQIVEQGIDAKIDEPIGTLLPSLFHPLESLVAFSQPGIERGKPAGGNVAAVRAAVQLLDSAAKLVVTSSGKDPAQHGHGDFLPPREGESAFIFFRRFLASAGALQDKTQERARGNIIRPQFQSEPQAGDGAA